MSSPAAISARPPLHGRHPSTVSPSPSSSSRSPATFGHPSLHLQPYGHARPPGRRRSLLLARDRRPLRRSHLLRTDRQTPVRTSSSSSTAAISDARFFPHGLPPPPAYPSTARPPPLGSHPSDEPDCPLLYALRLIVPDLADRDRPSRSLLYSSDTYAAVSTAISAPISGTGDDLLCQWLYETFQAFDPDLRLVLITALPPLFGALAPSSSSGTTTPHPSLPCSHHLPPPPRQQPCLPPHQIWISSPPSDPTTYPGFPLFTCIRTATLASPVCDTD